MKLSTLAGFSFSLVELMLFDGKILVFVNFIIYPLYLLLLPVMCILYKMLGITKGKEPIVS